MVRNLPEVKPKVPLLGISCTDMPLQGASTSSKPTVGEGQGHLAPKAGGPRLAKEALSGSARRKLKKAKARASRAIIAGIQQPGTANTSKQGGTSTKTPKRPRSEGSTLTETGQGQRVVSLQKQPELLKHPGTLAGQGPIRKL
jgi:hypothetical protein